jgi:tRNA threonylcarbamoyl adenosine modification protein (Sua5/YciO/YrdC/YwlC family)
MVKLVNIHPDNPQARLVTQVVEVLRSGGVIAYPTSSGYALGCRMSNYDGLALIRKIRSLSEKHDFTLMCSSISQASQYAKVDNSDFQLIKRLNAGQFTFILRALTALPKKAHSKRSTVGIRIASHQFVRDLLDELAEPILSTSLILPDEYTGESNLLCDSWAVQESVGQLVDMIIDVGELNSNPTTILDLSNGELEILREGQGKL